MSTDDAFRSSQAAEPVAWINPHDLAALKRGEEGVYLVYEVEVVGGAPLYDVCPSPQLTPMKDEEILSLASMHISASKDDVLSFVRAYEAVQGIT